ncbi:LppP/LprE family lipoprotein [Antrihabitans stalactiti]|uniref:LppP/LprE lipoprotein n=1 Tax=Antrihabitans stalactiti TaxID=2584121 RepID=A0A848KBD5_9NOCA|nr:LppP/LprE family lipoprotein [Antrihabitans stalactiti]NMN94818.1 hypothetical protein [Antrihabitans stalactiti]
MRVVIAIFAAAIAFAAAGCSESSSLSDGPVKIGETVTFTSDGTRILEVAVKEVVAVPEHCVYLDDDNQKVPAIGVKLRVTTADHFGPIVGASDFTATVDGAEQQVVNSAGWGPGLDGCDQQFPGFVDNYLTDNTTADGWVILRNPGNVTALTFTPDVPKTKLFEVKDREDLAHLTLSPRKMTVEVSVAAVATSALPAPSSSPGDTSSQTEASTTVGAPTPSSAPSRPTTNSGPQISGNGLCLDPTSTGVRNALASLNGDWTIDNSSDAQGGACPDLLWLSASGGNSAAAPNHVLFFHDGKYLGTATSEPYPFTQVVEADDDTVGVEYKWLVGDEAFCCPEGGPVTITYTWNGSTVVMNEPLPKGVTG